MPKASASAAGRQVLESVTTATRPTAGTIPALQPLGVETAGTDPVGGPARTFSMAELVARSATSPATVRYYLTVGLLPPPVRVAANRFLYDERHVEVVRLIRLLRERRGLSLEAIGRVLPELLPDLVGRPAGGLFRADVWREVLEAGKDDSLATRGRLVEVGTTLFSRRGYADVTVDDVCKATDIAKGSFYRYFASKEELFLAVAAAVARQVAKSFSGDAAPGIGPEEAVGVLAAAMSLHLAVVLDLTSLAAQRRPGYATALRSLTSTVGDAVRSTLDSRVVDHEPGTPDEVVARAVFEAVRRVVIADHSAPTGLLDDAARLA